MIDRLSFEMRRNKHPPCMSTHAKPLASAVDDLSSLPLVLDFAQFVGVDDEDWHFRRRMLWDNLRLDRTEDLARLD